MYNLAIILYLILLKNIEFNPIPQKKNKKTPQTYKEGKIVI